MKRNTYGVVTLFAGMGLAVAALVGAVHAARAAEVGDQVAVRVVCESEAIVNEGLNAMAADRNYRRANAMLAERINAGQCMSLPSPAQVEIASKGKSARFIDDDSDEVEWTVVAFKAGDRVFWSIVFEIIGQHPKRPPTRGAYIPIYDKAA